MTYEEFEETALGMWEEVPSLYKEGIHGIVVKRDSEAHPEHADYFTMGMCFTEPYGSGGPDSTRSILALYYGSFAKIAESDPEFPWEEELWETITHELRHHLEFLVEDDALERADYAMEQAHRRSEGLDFDPWYFQSGVSIAPGVYRVEDDIYIEQRWRWNQFRTRERLEFDWDGQRWAILRPAELGDVHYVWVRGPDTSGGQLQLVLVRELSMWERVGRLLARAPFEMMESEGEADLVRGDPR